MPPRSRLEVDAKVLCDQYGSRLVGALLRVMSGVSRIAALLHFIKRNSLHVPDRSVTYERNFQFAALQTFAYLKELTRAIADLNAAGIKGRLTDPAPWQKLRELQTYWETGTRAKVRDAVMFHLGFMKEVAAEVDKYAAADRPLPIFETDLDQSGLPMRFTAAEGLVMVASGLTLVDYGEIATEAVAAYKPLVESVFLIMDDLVRQCGARLPSLSRREVRLLGKDPPPTT